MRKMFMGLLALLCLGVHPARADAPITVQAGGKEIYLALPEKTCAYSRKEKADAKILDDMELANPKSQVLLAFIDCENLKLVHGVKGVAYAPGYYGQILSDRAGQAVADKYTREEYVKAVANGYGKETPEQVMARGERMLRDLMDNDRGIVAPQTIGMIRQDKDLIQLGILGSQQTPGGLKKIVNVITLTKLDVPVAITLGHPATPPITLEDVSNRAAIYAHQLMELNPEAAPPFAHGIEKWSALAGAVCGFLIGLLLGILLRSR